LNPISGAIVPQPALACRDFLDYIRRGVIEQFEKVPPLVDSKSQTAITSKASMSVSRRILTEISAFHDGCLVFHEPSSTVRGVIPVYPGNNRAFKPMCCVPIKITLVHMIQNDAKLPPLVFVGPLDDDMVLVPTSIVDGGNGQVRGLPSLQSWNGLTSSLTTLFLEMQAAFCEQLPIQNRGNLDQPPPPAVTPQASSNGSPIVVNPSNETAGPPQPSSSSASASDIPDQMLCIICMSEPKRFIALPCRHLLFCSGCVEKYSQTQRRDCPVCRTTINDLFEIYT